MKHKWVVGSVALIVVLMVLAMFFGEKPLRQYPDYAAESPAPEGIKAFVTLLDKYYDRVEIWPEKGKMPEGSGHLVMMVEPGGLGEFGRFLTDEEEALWIDWMKRGNSLWLVGQHPAEICSLWGEKAIGKDDAGGGSLGVFPDEEGSQVQGGDELSGVYQASVVSRTRLELKTGDKSLLWDELGVVCSARSYGAGELVALNVPEWLQNAGILEGDRVRILTRLLTRSEPRDIWFYEEAAFSGAPQQENSAWSVIPVGVYYVVALLVVLVVLELWRRGMRFGAAEAPREGAVRFGDERIRALGSWYHRQGFYAEALAIQARYLNHLMREVWGIAGRQDESRLQRILHRRMGSENVEEWMRNYRWICDKRWPDKMSQKEYVMWSQRVSRMQQEVQS